MAQYVPDNDPEVKVLDIDPRTNFEITNFENTDGTHDGGTCSGPGFIINWQRGPVIQPDGSQVQNGAFMETVLASLIAQMEYNNSGQYNCKENTQAIAHMSDALTTLGERRMRRQAQGKSGTHIAEDF